MKSLMHFLQRLLNEIGSQSNASTHLDFNTIEKRVKHEGLSFLAITLPNFGKEFERALDRGYVRPADFAGYTKYITRTKTEHGKTSSVRSAIPQFLEGLMRQVFDIETGVLLDSPSIVSIRGIRQLTLAFSKIEVECSEKRISTAMDKWVECETETHDISNLIASKKFRDNLLDFQQAGDVLWTELFSKIDKTIFDEGVVPQHGPGSTADKLLGNKKYLQYEWTERLEEYFSWTEYLFPSYTLALSCEERMSFREPGQERPVKVTPVPKTLKTPRIIAIEPTAMQYVQQGILEIIENEIKRTNYPRKFIDWNDQTPNQRLARRGSLFGDLATLDLSEASDRVSNLLVEALLRRFPTFSGAVQACRSVSADVPGKGIIPLTKFASMGSALCFPIEAMVFCTIVFTAIARQLNTPVSPALLKRMVGDVRIYGDDIIVPVEYVDSVVTLLEVFGLKVNVNKSFWTGKFRESCGKEYFKGFDVSIVKVRRVFPTSRKHVAEVISLVSLRNQLFEAGFPETIEYLDSIIEKLIPFPYVLPGSPALGRYSYDRSFTVDRMSPSLQKPMVKAATVSGKLPSSKLDGAGALMKFFLKRGDLPMHDERHLLRAGRPISLTLKIGWTSPI